MLQKVRDEAFVTFVGSPGSGKSATVRHIALTLEKEGYEILPITLISEVEKYCDTKNPQVFVLDDVVGMFGLQFEKLKELHQYRKRIEAPCMSKTKCLMTCREAVFNQIVREERDNDFILKHQNIIRFHREEYALTDTDKKTILSKYYINEELLSSEKLRTTSKMFPLLCTLFAEYVKYGETFFENPIPCIQEQLGSLQKKNKIHYASLVLIVVFGNKVTKEKLEDPNFDKIKKCFLEKCFPREFEFSDRMTSNSEIFMEAISDMCGTYTNQYNSEFSFIHDSMYEIVAHHFGSQHPDLIIKYLDSGYIANYINPTIEDHLVYKFSDNQGHGDKENIPEKLLKTSLQIELKEDMFPEFALRLYKDIGELNLFDVFKSEHLKHHGVCQEFIELLESKDYTELYALFFAEQEHVSKIARYNIGELNLFNVFKSKHLKLHGVCQDLIEPLDYTELYAFFFGEQEHVSKKARHKETEELKRETKKVHDVTKMLMHERRIQRKMAVKFQDRFQSYVYSVRVVSWVIYYGHHEILKYILYRMKVCRENENDLFEKNNVTHIENVYSLKKLERIRLLLLACYSGDIKTVNLLLKHVDKNSINSFLDYPCTHLWPKRTPLTAACQKGHAAVAKVLLDFGADVNLHNNVYDSPLVVACRGGHEDAVNVLLDNRANVNLQGEQDTPLTAACEVGHEGIVKTLLSKGADINQNNGIYESPLTTSCKYGHISLIYKLLDNNAEVNPRVADYTPLTYACWLGNIDIVKALLAKGASVNLENTTRLTSDRLDEDPEMVEIIFSMLSRDTDNPDPSNIKGMPIDAACRKKNMVVVKELLKHGVKVSCTKLLLLACDCVDEVMLDVAQKRKDFVPVAFSGRPFLHDVCQKQSAAVIYEILNAGNKINWRYTTNKLLITVCQFRKPHLNLVTKIIKSIPNDPLHQVSEEENKNTLNCLLKSKKFDTLFGEILELASGKGNVKVLQLILELGEGAFNIDSVYKPACFAACKENQLQIVEILLDNIDNLNFICGNDTPLTVACTNGSQHVVEMLLGNKANVDFPGEIDTPLTAACKRGHVSVVQRLIDVDADVNKKGVFDTPLLAACKFGHASVAKRLLRSGANVNMSGRFSSPLTVACSYGFVDIVKILLQRGANVNILEKVDISKYMRGEAKVIINCLDRCPPEYCTPLTAASRAGHLNVVIELLKARADINKTDSHETPLIAACRRGHVNIVEKLLEEGADVNLKSDDGITALYETLFCIDENRFQILKKLTKYHVDYSYCPPFYPNPIKFALVKHNNVVLREMLKSDTKNKKVQKNAMLFDTLIEIRNSRCVQLDYKDDVVVSAEKTWRLSNIDFLWNMIATGDSAVLERLFYLGLDVNQEIQLLSLKTSDSQIQVRDNVTGPLLYIIFAKNIENKTEKTNAVFEAGTSIVGYSLLCKIGINALETIQHLIQMCNYINILARLAGVNIKSYNEDVVFFKKLMDVIKKQVRRQFVSFETP